MEDNEKTPEGADSYSLRLNTDNYTTEIRQVLLDLLTVYQDTDKPMNPELLKIFIESSEDKIQALIEANYTPNTEVEQQVLIGRRESIIPFEYAFENIIHKYPQVKPIFEPILNDVKEELAQLNNQIKELE